jgi:hypothetical protein
MICKWVRFGYKVLPLPSWRAFLLERHLGRCPECQSFILDNETIRSLGITDASLQAELPLWPVPSSRHETQVLRLGWRFAFGLSLGAAILWAAFGIARIAHFGSLPQGTVTVTEAQDNACVFAVLEARIGGEPARPVIFKPQQPGMTIVWFEKIKN